MRIAVIRRKYLSVGGGGAEKYARVVCRELSRRGHLVTLVAETFDGEDRGRFEHLRVLPSRLSAFSGTVAFFKAAAGVMAEKTGAFDVTYALSRYWPVDVFRVTEQLHAEWAKKRYGAWRHINPRHQGISRLERQIFQERRALYAVANSEMAKREVLAHYAYPEERIRVIRNGVDRDQFFPAESREEKRLSRKRFFADAADDDTVFLFVAEKFRIKGLEEALRALAGLPADAGWRFYVAGGDDPAPYRELAARLGLADRVTFLGSCRQLRDYYAAADLLLYPSWGEPFANVCLEACACGLPVLTTAANGSSELVNEGEGGYIIPNAEAIDIMTARLREFVDFAPDRKTRFSLAALDAAKEYDWIKHADQLERLFETVLREKHQISH